MGVSNTMFWNATVIAFVVAAAAGDARWRKIPRTLTTAGLLTGLAFHIYSGGLHGFAWAAVTCLIGFAIGLTFFQLGAIGGGDVKLVTALGAMLGWSKWIYAMEIAILVAGAVALLQALRHGVLRQTIRNVWEMLRWIFMQGVKAHPVFNVSNAATLRAPFGVAAAVGTLIAVIGL